MDFIQEKEKVYNKSVYITEFKNAPEKTISNDLKTFSHFLLDQIGCKVFELTCEYIPSQSKIEDAWNTIKQREKFIIDILQECEDVYFILSGIETHTGKKSKIKLKDDEDSEDEAEIVDEEDKYKFLYTITPEMEKDNPNIYEILFFEIFSKFDENLNPIKVKDRNVSVDVIYFRIYNLINLLLKSVYEDKIQFNKKIFIERIRSNEGFLKGIYEIMKNSFPNSVSSVSYNRENTLQGYPHIHLAIAVKNDSKYFNTCSDIEAYVKSYENLPFYDIKATRLAETSSKKNGKSLIYNTSLDGPIFSYVLKNDRFYKTYLNLNKNTDKLIHSITLFNWNNDENVSRFFKFFTQYGIRINNVEVGNLSKEELKLLTFKNLHKPFIYGDLDSNPKTKSVITSSDNAKIRAIKQMCLFMEENNFAFTYDGQVYKKIQGSINSWSLDEIVKNAEGLYYAARNIDSNIDLFTEHFKKEFIETSKNINQTEYPKVFVDGFSIEYKDFYYWMPSRAIIIKNQDPFQHYPCVNYFPYIEFSDLEKIEKYKIKPDNWLDILRNSGYIDDNGKPIGLYGKSLLQELQNYASSFRPDKAKQPCLLGQTNSCKSTSIETINKAFPSNTILILNDNSDRFVFEGLNNPSINKVYSDEPKDGKKSVIDTTTMLKLANFSSEISVSIRAKKDVQLINKFSIAQASHTFERFRSPNVLKLLYDSKYRKYDFISHSNCIIYDEIKTKSEIQNPLNNKFQLIENEPENKIIELKSREMMLVDEYKQDMFSLGLLRKYNDNYFVYRTQKTICDDMMISTDDRNYELNKDIDQGLNSRYSLYSFKTMKTWDPDGKARCFEEAPLVILYLGVASSETGKFNYCESITECDYLIKKSSSEKISFLSDRVKSHKKFKHDGEYVRDKINFKIPCSFT
jgi:hypothetical protein